MAGLPRTFEIAREGVVVTVLIEGHEALLALRTELELLSRFGRGINERLIAALRARLGQFGTKEQQVKDEVGEMLAIMTDALSPVTAATIAIIDRDFPEVRGAISMGSIQNDSEKFHEDVAAQARQSGLADADEIAAAFSEAGLVDEAEAQTGSATDQEADIDALLADAGAGDDAPVEPFTEEVPYAVDESPVGADEVDDAGDIDVDALLAEATATDNEPADIGKPASTEPGEISEPEAATGAVADAEAVETSLDELDPEADADGLDVDAILAEAGDTLEQPAEEEGEPVASAESVCEETQAEVADDATAATATELAETLLEEASVETATEDPTEQADPDAVAAELADAEAADEQADAVLPDAGDVEAQLAEVTNEIDAIADGIADAAPEDAASPEAEAEAPAEPMGADEAEAIEEALADSLSDEQAQEDSTQPVGEISQEPQADDAEAEGTAPTAGPGDFLDDLAAAFVEATGDESASLTAEPTEAGTDAPADTQAGASETTSTAESTADPDDLAAAFEEMTSELQSMGNAIEEVINSTAPADAPTEDPVVPVEEEPVGQEPESIDEPTSQVSAEGDTAASESPAWQPTPSSTRTASVPIPSLSLPAGATCELRQEMERIRGELVVSLDHVSGLLDRIDTIHREAEQQASALQQANQQMQAANQQLNAAQTEALEAKAAYEIARGRLETAQAAWENAQATAQAATRQAQPRTPAGCA